MSPVAEGGRFDRLWKFRDLLGHYAVPVGIAIMVVDAVNRFFINGVGGAFLALALCLTLGFWLFGFHLHEHVLCTRCARDVPDGMDDKTRNTLAWCHKVHDSPKGVFVYVLGPALALIWIPTAATWFPLPPLLITLLTAISAVALAPYVIQAHLISTHHRHRPWCPYCRDWEDGGDHEASPTPDPVGEKTA